MGVFIGYSLPALRPTGRAAGFIDWKHQPWDRGANPKPDAIDSALVTVQIEPEIPDFDGNQAGSGYTDLFASMVWSAGGTGYLTAEFDLVRGTSATVAATSIKIEVTYSILNPGNNPAVPELPGFKGVKLDASLGRGSRSSNDILIRTIYLGSLAANVTSAPVKIRPFARALYLTSRLPTGAAFSALVVQRSGSPTGPIVQVDTVSGTQPLQFVPISHVASYVEVTPTTAQDLSCVFRIILP